MTKLILDPVARFNPEQFKQLCAMNPEAVLELTNKGELIIMPSTGGETGERNSSLTAQLWFWNNQQRRGKVFDSSTMFQLPSGAFRSPDVSWVELSRWESLSEEDRQTFPPLCPDFVVELRSQSDSLRDLREKMAEYLENGAKLGWLIDPKLKQVEIYRRDQSVEILQNPLRVVASGDLSGFILDISCII